MGRLRDELPRGIPHEEFVRRKAAARRLDRGLSLIATVPWPAWSGLALLLIPFPAAAVLGVVATGELADLLLGPAMLLALLLVATVLVEGSEFVRGRRDRRRGVPPETPSAQMRGPRPVFLALLVATVLPVVFLLSLLRGGGVPVAVGTVATAVVLVSACSGLAIVRTQVSARLAARRSAPR